MPTTIAAVLAELDLIIERTILENDPMGYFAYVYRRTTAAVEQAVRNKRFRDNQRMEAFDVRFANLYLQAYEQYRCAEPCAASWQLAFDSCRENKAILQHVMLGMNAHINLDLGVSAAQLMEGDDLAELAADFRVVNNILQEIIEELQERIARVSPLFGLSDRLARDKDELILDFSMRAAREQAWVVAGKVWAATADQEQVIQRIDGQVRNFGSRLARPRGRFARWLWKAIAAVESGQVGRNLERLKG